MTTRSGTGMRERMELARQRRIKRQDEVAKAIADASEASPKTFVTLEQLDKGQAHELTVYLKELDRRLQLVPEDAGPSILNRPSFVDMALGDLHREMQVRMSLAQILFIFSHWRQSKDFSQRQNESYRSMMIRMLPAIGKDLLAYRRGEGWVYGRE